MKRVAVIGLGDISGAHLEAIEENEALILCAVCDINTDKKKAVREGTIFYTDYKDMIEREKPDCVHICLPHCLHYKVAKDLVERGIHVFVKNLWRLIVEKQRLL